MKQNQTLMLATMELNDTQFTILAYENDSGAYALFKSDSETYEMKALYIRDALQRGVSKITMNENEDYCGDIVDSIFDAFSEVSINV